jgi:hypothetical protein
LTWYTIKRNRIKYSSSCGSIKKTHLKSFTNVQWLGSLARGKKFRDWLLKKSLLPIRSLSANTSTPWLEGFVFFSRIRKTNKRNQSSLPAFCPWKKYKKESHNFCCRWYLPNKHIEKKGRQPLWLWLTAGREAGANYNDTKMMVFYTNFWSVVFSRLWSGMTFPLKVETVIIVWLCVYLLPIRNKAYRIYNYSIGKLRTFLPVQTSNFFLKYEYWKIPSTCRTEGRSLFFRFHLSILWFGKFHYL